MKHITLIAICIALNITSQIAIAEEQPQAGSTTSTQDSPTSRDELHFVIVLTFHGEIVAVDPAKRLIKLKGPTGEIIKLEAESEGVLAERKVGERVLFRYFEGGQIGKNLGSVPVQSPKDGMLGGVPGGKHALAATVERVDADNQEVTLKGADGGLL